MFASVLIANRGEIAVRVARTCREMGIRVIAVCSTADRDSPVTSLADRTVVIGPPAPKASYLYVPNIVEAAVRNGAEAIHPGYGFLSEDPDFAEICAKEGLRFIGPAPEVMQRLGNKATARALMAEAGLPLLPGTVDPVRTVDEGLAAADEIGYPVIIKAAAGGGGRGMTVVRHRADFPEAYATTTATAHAVFRDPSVYVERYLDRARHVEVQVLCDDHGGALHLGERDCSVQRRHQKLVEETPSTWLTAEVREAIGAAAVRGARSVGYSGAGTVEFLLDDAGRFYFMEMNARIQVEHPVTEQVTGIDLVREQIRIAAGEPLGYDQAAIRSVGASVECRINAEDPERGFTPAAGRIDVFDVPGGPGTRVDTGYRAGSVVTPYYDSLVAKVVVWAPDRGRALDRMDRALAELRLEGRGMVTTTALQRRILRHPTFRAGEHTIGFLDELMAAPADDTSAGGARHKHADTSRRGRHRPEGTDQMTGKEFTIADLMDLLVEQAGLPAADRSDDAAQRLPDVGLDSLAFLQLQAALQDRYGFELPDDRPTEYTFGEIVSAINDGLAKVDA